MSFSSGGRALSKEPFRIVVLGEFGPADASGPKRHKVDGGSFDEVLATVGPKLTIEIPEPLTLSFDSFKSLRPEGLVRQIPGGQERMIVRQALGQLKNRKISGDEGLSRIRSASIGEDLKGRILSALGSAAAPSIPAAPPAALPPPAPKPSSDDGDPLGGLLSMVDVPGKEAPSAPERRPSETKDPAASALSAAISSIVGGGRTGSAPGNAALDAAMEILDGDLARDLVTVLHHEDFRRYEAAWRGLRLLVTRVDFREGITVEIVNASAERTAETLRALVLQKASGESGEPISLLIGTAPTPVDAEHFEDLAECGRAAMTLGAPFVTGVSFFDAARIAALPEWPAFREHESASWIGLAANPILLRLPFGEETEPVRDFRFEEPAGHLLFGSPALAVAAVAAASQARFEWPGLFEGRDIVVSDLPVQPAHPIGGHAAAAESIVGPDEARKLAESGFIPVVPTPDRDPVFVPQAPLAGKGSSLPYRLSETRLVQLFNRALRESSGSLDLAGYEALLRKRYAALGQSPEALTVSIGPAKGWPDDFNVLTVRCRPTPPVLPVPRDMELHFLV